VLFSFHKFLVTFETSGNATFAFLSLSYISENFDSGNHFDQIRNPSTIYVKRVNDIYCSRLSGLLEKIFVFVFTFAYAPILSRKSPSYTMKLKYSYPASRQVLSSLTAPSLAMGGYFPWMISFRSLIRSITISVLSWASYFL